jgi:hypothetical protein
MSEINNADIIETPLDDELMFAFYGHLTQTPIAPAVPDVPDCDEGMANWLSQLPISAFEIREPVLQAQVYYIRQQ